MVKQKNLFLIFIFIFLISFTSADFSVSNYSIKTSYGPGQNVLGWINISFDEESADSIFEDSNSNKISLLEMLSQNPDYIFTCNPENCDIDYTANNPEKSKTFSLPKEDSKLIGIKLFGNITEITSLNFNIESNAPASCDNQIHVDLFNDKIIDTGNNKVGSSLCSSKQGCFDEENENLAELEMVKYKRHCQRIKFPEAPGFRLGAWIKNSAMISLFLLDENQEEVIDEEGNLVGCFLQDCQTNCDQGKYETCEITFLVTEPKDYYVCVAVDDDSFNPISSVRGYDTSEGCGFFGGLSGIYPENAAFDIFVQNKEFASLEGSTLAITNEISEEDNLALRIEDYLLFQYGNLDCLSHSCVVPINLISGASQSLTIKDLELKFVTTSGGKTETNFYEVATSSPKINSEFQKLFLDLAEFKVPTKYGNATINLELGGEEIYSKKIIVEEIPIIKGLTPMTTASAFPTKFTTITNSNISKSTWDFGDDSKQTSNSKEIIHTYDAIGNYTITVTLTDKKGKSATESFEISVESPEKEINRTIAKFKGYLQEIENQIIAYDSFIQSTLKDYLMLEDLEDQLIEIQKEYDKATTEEELNGIMEALIYLEIPKAIGTSAKSRNVPFYSSEDNIDLKGLEIASGKSYSDDDYEAYIEAIKLWNQKNLKSTFSFESIKGISENYESLIFNLVEIDIQNTGYETAYLVLYGLENLKFKTDYGEQEKEGYTYLEIGNDEKIIFTTTSEITISNLPAFISPGFEDLVIEDKQVEPKSKARVWILFLLILFLIVILGFMGYIFLQGWYRKKYEDYLFKDKNNLYNIATFIKISKDKQMEEKIIKQKLKEHGWNSEQIDYVFNKYYGKRTGMFEIPVEKILSIFRKKEKEKLRQKLPQGQKLPVEKPQFKPRHFDFKGRPKF